MNRDLILAARDIVGGLTPMRSDCGRLCGAACCAPDEDGQGGVYLFPGEEALLDGVSWGKVVPDDFAPMLVCEEACQRDARPFACRIFPLTPVRREDGRWTVRMDARARAMCPLVRSGVKGLDPDFAKAVRRAIRLLAEDPQMDAFLTRWQTLEEEYRFEL